jgi:PAS domain S-box-containing protein
MEVSVPSQSPLFQRAFEEAGVALALLSLDGRWLHVNRALCQMTGYETAELQERTLQMISSTEEEHVDLRVVNEVLSGDVECHRVRSVLVHKSGASVPALLNFSLLRDDDGAPHLFILQVQGVPHLKQLETAEGLFEMPKALHFVAGYDGYFKRLSRSWTDILGHRIETLLSRPYLEFVHPEDWERTKAEASRVEQGEEAVLFENRYQHADGTYRWLLWTALPVTSERMIYGVAIDYTDRRKIEWELEVALKEQRRLYTELLAATGRIKELRGGLIKICAWTKRIHIGDRWIPTDEFLREHLQLKVSHGISDEAAALYFPDSFPVPKSEEPT